MLKLFVLFLNSLILCSSIQCGLKYCISQMANSNLAITIGSNFKPNATSTGLVFPDAEFYGFLRDHNYNENQVTKIDFGQYCNVIFDEELLDFNPLKNLKTLQFDKICWLNSIHHGYCLNVPDEEWKNDMQLINNRFCLSTPTNLDDEVALLYDELEDSKNHVILLNNSLNRALHLYKETERTSKQLQLNLDKFKQERQICESNLNRTVGIARYRHKQLFKCTGQLERTQQMKIEKFKNVLEDLYGNFINLLYDL